MQGDRDNARGHYGQSLAESSPSSPVKTLLLVGSVAVIGLWAVGEAAHKRRGFAGWRREKREWVPASKYMKEIK